MPEPLPAYPSLEFETHLWKGSYSRIAGIDEAGRGAWAGPVCAAAVILPPDPCLLQSLGRVRDSKLMTPLARQRAAPLIRAAALACGVGFASAREIDTLGIVPATKLAARRALEGLAADTLLTDYLLFPDLDLLQTALVKGDRRSLSVAAASVLAKTARDALMIDLDEQVPGYGFAHHKGYGTREHREALGLLGLSPHHRCSFAIHGGAPLP
jgi:ribonuclease HII